MKRTELIRRLLLVAIVLVTGYGALLRLDALVAKYGAVDSPSWARVLTTSVAPIGRDLRPYNLGWPRDRDPYEGGDPINYLRFAREMTHFYQPHVREPVFLAITRTYLWLLENQDVAVSFASATGSVLAIVGTYLLAAALMPRAAALGAALLVAIDYEIVTWSVDGWRDDTFMAGVLWTAWALVRLEREPIAVNGIFAGACAGFACLTRITALTFIVPALVWLAFAGPADLDTRRARRRAIWIAWGAAALIVAPYMISCALRWGDPLIAVNYHTIYYRDREGMPIDRPMSAADYIRTKFAQRPVETFDTGFMGVFVEPFVTKWSGLRPIVGAAHVVLAWSAAAGLMLFTAIPSGRLLLIVLSGSLIPYAFTWNISGGNAWRFTMHAYPIYLAAGWYAIAQGWKGVELLRREGRACLRMPGRRAVAGTIAVVLVTCAILAGYTVLPWFVVREAIAHHEDVNVATGRRDTIFYREGWSPPHDDGVVVRASMGGRSRIDLPLPEKASYDFVLRIDPIPPETPQPLSVLFNGQYVARFQLTSNPERMGSYRFRVRPDQVRPGRNELTLIPDRVVPAREAGKRFSWLPPDAQTAVRVWYVRVLSNVK